MMQGTQTQVQYADQHHYPAFGSSVSQPVVAQPVPPINPPLAPSIAYPVAAQPIAVAAVQPGAQPGGVPGGVPVYPEGPQGAYAVNRQGYSPLPKDIPKEQQVQPHPDHRGDLFTDRWSDSLFACHHDCANALLACFCTPVRFGLTLYRAGFRSAPFATCLFAFFWVMFIVGAIGFGAFWWSTARAAPEVFVAIGCLMMALIGTIYRVKLAQKYSIPHNVAYDCCVHFFCECCSLAQEGRHVDRAVGLLV